jgi:hypothetical protein
MTNSIRITRGATINLGNYESSRVEVSSEVEVGGTPEEAEAGCVMVNEECKRFLKKEVEAIQQAAGLPPRPAERFTG